MNYDQPRQLESGGWHYTRMNDRQVWALGYCRDHLDRPHDTADQARECYARYLMAERLDLDGFTSSSWRLCEASRADVDCRELTNRYVQLDGWVLAALCDQHRTREVCVQLYGAKAHDSIHS